MILIGIDDTDVAGSRGTNQLARQIVRSVAADWQCLWIVRHQLLDDPRVPCTTKNGSASIALERRSRSGETGPDTQTESDTQQVTAALINALLTSCRDLMRTEFIDGSDPGLCLLSGACPQAVINWGASCQHEFVSRDVAYQIARDNDVHLESLGGTEDGVIGALAAVGLASLRNDGRIVQWREWPDDLSNEQDVQTLAKRDVCARHKSSGSKIEHGIVDVGKHLRPNLRSGAAVLTVEPVEGATPHLYRALKLP
jgi:tRNA(Ile2) C34 agmatinyltransferase TiaS